MARTVAQVGDELYALPPQAFTAARDEAVARARADGDTDLARALAAFKRPTVAAWLVNLVMLRHPKSLDRLLALGERLRAAHGTQEVRELTGQRRAQLREIQTLASDLARGAGAAEPTAAQLAEVESTFSAALVDRAAAGSVRSARLVKPLSYGGFGELAAAPGAPPVATPATAVPATTPTRPDEDAEAARREAQAAAARERVDEARRAHDEAVRAEQAVAAEVEYLTGEIARLRAELDTAQRHARDARQSRLATEKDLASAQRRLARFDPP